VKQVNFFIVCYWPQKRLDQMDAIHSGARHGAKQFVSSGASATTPAGQKASMVANAKSLLCAYAVGTALTGNNYHSHIKIC
jgi:hypothetical protein